MFIDGSRGARIERTAMHELVHDLLRRQSDAAPPLWVEEGLAEYFSSAAVEPGRIVAGTVIREHMARLRRRRQLTVDELIGTTPESPAAASAMFYAESWAAVDWLMSLDDQAFFPFMRELEGGATTAAALQQHYGKTLSDLQRGIRSRNRGTRVVIDATPERSGVALPLDRATLLYELGRFLTHVPGAEREAQRHFAEALVVNPRHARTLAILGRLDDALAAGPDDPEVHLLYAESLLTTATGPFAGVFEAGPDDAFRFRKARELAGRGLALGGEEALARGLIGTSWMVEADATPGIPELERSRALAPHRADFALNLYAMYLRSGERTKADALFAAAFANTRDRQTSFAARNVLLVAETARANALVAEGKLAEAAALVRTLAAATPDQRGRAELERQAAKLESTATVNQHIRMYNEAIALSNAGRDREALKAVDALLAVATDAQVIADAKRLRADLRK